MTSIRPTLHDDDGDRFPGAVPATSSAPTAGADERMVRMHAAYVSKANALVEAGREDLTGELAEAFTAESAHAADAAHGPRRGAGRGTPSRTEDGRRPGRTSRLSRLTRTSLQRFDRYTLDVFNAGSPYRTRDDRSA